MLIHELLVLCLTCWLINLKKVSIFVERGLASVKPHPTNQSSTTGRQSGKTIDTGLSCAWDIRSFIWVTAASAQCRFKRYLWPYVRVFSLYYTCVIKLLIDTVLRFEPTSGSFAKTLHMHKRLKNNYEKETFSFAPTEWTVIWLVIFNRSPREIFFRMQYAFAKLLKNRDVKTKA